MDGRNGIKNESPYPALFFTRPGTAANAAECGDGAGRTRQTPPGARGRVRSRKEGPWRGAVRLAFSLMLILSALCISAFAQSNATGEEHNGRYISRVYFTGTEIVDAGVQPIIVVDTGSEHSAQSEIRYALMLKSEFDRAITDEEIGSFGNLLNLLESGEHGANKAFGLEAAEKKEGGGKLFSYIYGGVMGDVEPGQSNVTISDRPTLPKEAADYFLLVWSSAGPEDSTGTTYFYGIDLSLDDWGKPLSPPPAGLTLTPAAPGTARGGFTGQITAGELPEGEETRDWYGHYQIDIYDQGFMVTSVTEEVHDDLIFSVPLTTNSVDADKEYTAEVFFVTDDWRGFDHWAGSHPVASATSVTATRAKLETPSAPRLAAGGATHNSLKLEEVILPGYAKMQYQLMDRGAVGSAEDTSYGSWTDLPPDRTITGLTMNHSYNIIYRSVATSSAHAANFEESAPTEPLTAQTANLTVQTVTFSELPSAALDVAYGNALLTYTAQISPIASGAEQEITYDSNNTDVATVNGSGTVTIVGVGNTIITAIAPEISTYSGGSKSYAIHVSPRELSVTANATKTYDGTNTLTLADLEQGYTLDSRVGADGVSLATLTGTFHTADVHTGTLAAVSAVSLTGRDADNYELPLSNVTITGSITKLAVTGQPGFGLTTDHNSDATAQAGDIFTASLGTLNAVNLNVSSDLEFQWLRNGASIEGATGGSYTVTAEDVEQQITVSVTAKPASNYQTAAALVSAPQTPGKESLGGTLTIEGAAVYAGSLNLNTRALVPAAVTDADLNYQWLRNGSNIEGATAKTYVIQRADLGTVLSAIATAKTDAAYTGSVTAQGLTVGTDAPADITTNTLPNGTVGTAYSATLAATGDTPITWSIVTGSLPSGLTLNNGAISGTPTAAGSVTFTVQAANGTPPDSRKELTIVIANKDSSGNPGGSGSDNDDDDDDGPSRPTTTVTTEKPPATADAPNPPTEVTIKPPATVGKDGKVEVSIPDATIHDAIEKAVAQAKKDGATENGIAVSIDLSGLKTEFNTLPLTLSKNAYQDLVDAGVKALDIHTPQISLSLDLETLKTISGAADGDVTINAALADRSALTDAAQAALGERPLYEITIVTGGKNVTRFGGEITITLPYALRTGETAENLWMAWVNADEGFTYITDSEYRAGNMIARTNHLTVFGVAEKPGFTDVPADAWYAGAVQIAVGKGLFSGTSATTFGPEVPMTRGMLATVLHRMAGAPAAGGAAFPDVSADSYCAEAVAWASGSGLVEGYGDGSFGPDDAVTREQLAAILYRCAGAPAVPDLLLDFTDAGEVGDWASDAVRWAVDRKLLQGSGGALMPQSTATRAQVAAILVRYLTMADA